MLTSSKGLNERYRLHAYVSATVYHRSWKGTTGQFVLIIHRSWKGTTGQFVLNIHEQFRQLDELTPLKEQLSHSVR